MEGVINKKLIFDTLDHIEQHPEEWDQSAWFCDTTACFAGRALLLSGCRIVDTAIEEPILPVGHYPAWLDTFEMVNERNELVFDVQANAFEVLGLPRVLASRIFGYHTRDVEKLRHVVEEVVAEAERLQREDDHS